MKDPLRSLFYKTLNGVATAPELKAKASEKGLNYTLQQVKDFLAKQESNQRFRKQDKRQLFTPITAEPYTYQCDLMFLTQERTSTAIVRKDPVLVVVEISSRKGYFRAMPDKSASTTAKAMDSIINAICEANQKINVLEHDMGSEFIGKEFLHILEEHDIQDKPYPAQNNSKTAMAKVERLNGTIRRWWNVGFRGRLTPAEAIPLIEAKYNSTPHRSTGKKPNDITHRDQYTEARINDVLKGAPATQRIDKAYPVGTKVRLRSQTDVFKKKSEPAWSSTVHIVEEKKGANFKVSGQDTDLRAWEMLPVKKVQTAPKKKKKTPEPTAEAVEPEKEPVKEPEPEPRKKRVIPPKPAPEAPTPKPKRQPKVYTIDFPIRNHIWKGDKLDIKVKYSHLSEEQNKKYEWQPATILFTDTAINENLVSYLKQHRQWTRFQKAYPQRKSSR